MGIGQVGQFAFADRFFKKSKKFKVVKSNEISIVNNWLEEGYEVEYLGQSSAVNEYSGVETTYSFWIYKEKE